MTHSRTRGGSSLRVTWLAFDLHVAFPHSKKFVYMSALITWRAHIHKVTLSSEWHASFFWVTNLSSESHESFFPVTWLIFSLHSALTYLMWIVFVHSHMTWLAFGLHSCICLFVYVPRMSLRICLLYVSLCMSLRICSKIHWSSIKYFFVRDMTHSYVRGDSFLQVTWLAFGLRVALPYSWGSCIRLFVRDMTHSYTRGDSFFRVTWLAFGLHVALPYLMTFVYVCSYVSWLIHMREVTLSLESHDSLLVCISRLYI